MVVQNAPVVQLAAGSPWFVAAASGVAAASIDLSKSCPVYRKTSTKFYPEDCNIYGGFQSHRPTPRKILCFLVDFPCTNPSQLLRLPAIYGTPRSHLGIASSEAPALGHADRRCREGLTGGIIPGNCFTMVY